MRVLRKEREYINGAADADVVVVGSGIVGAACAESLTRRGAQVLVLDRGPLAAGTTACGEGNLLVSGRAPGPGLALAQASLRRWPRLLAALREELGPGRAECEYEAKGGLVVATDDPSGIALRAFAAAQRAAGVDARELAQGEAAAYEPHLTPGVRAAVHYPEDAQLQPVLAATSLLAAVRARGGRIRTDVEVTGVETGRDGQRIVGVRTSEGRVPCGAVVNACGPWAGQFAAAAGAPLPVLPRQGTVLVTAPLPHGTVRHKVYDAGYVRAVGNADAALQVAAVVEATQAGTVLIGSSRRAGFDATLRADVLRALARGAARLFPVLGGVPVMRAYGGFRPYTPDHLPVVGEDPRRPGLWHATGHEGAGIGLAAATGELLAELWAGEPPHVDPEPFRAGRFASAAF
ncbi:NAD(P)/FAD-dependent oxidoreductase [Streptomyces roseoverticillatus]|uniref:NAD(P)/FAD-dependent oxidoreductase n=1 Tax=Streptomyces roseoverticillatus TaxID=66429 RepID=UPI000B267DA0|nr:FAD-dependent oxidoreductase [Streptomyces roseoverticillatus]